MARPDAGGAGGIVGLVLHHPLEERRDAVGAQATLLEQVHAGLVRLPLEGAAVAHGQQGGAAAADRGQDVGVTAGQQLDQHVDAEGAHHALGRMKMHDMADFVRQHARDLRAARVVDQRRIENEDPARQGEGIDHLALHHVHRDLVRIACFLCQIVGQAVDRGEARGAGADLLIGRDLVEHGLAQLHLPRVRQQRRGIAGAILDHAPEQADQRDDRQRIGAEARRDLHRFERERFQRRHQRDELRPPGRVLDHQPRLAAAQRQRRHGLMVRIAQHEHVGDWPARHEAGVFRTGDEQLLAGDLQGHVLHVGRDAVVVAGGHRQIPLTSNMSSRPSP